MTITSLDIQRMYDVPKGYIKMNVVYIRNRVTPSCYTIAFTVQWVMYVIIRYYHNQSYCLLKYTDEIPKAISYTSH